MLSTLSTKNIIWCVFLYALYLGCIQHKQRAKAMKKIKSEILGKEFRFQATHLILTVDNDLWIRDKWSIRINDEIFDYRTGIGHRKTRSKEGKRLMNSNPKKTKSNLLIYADQLVSETRPIPPKIDDVLHSLVMDAEAQNLSFSEWCDTFGYSNDSKKAESIYNLCLENSRKVETLGINIEKATELFQDY